MVVKLSPVKRLLDLLNSMERWQQALPLVSRHWWWLTALRLGCDGGVPTQQQHKLKLETEIFKDEKQQDDRLTMRMSRLAIG